MIYSFFFFVLFLNIYYITVLKYIRSIKLIEKELDIKDDYPFNFDLERMKEALSSPRTKYLVSNQEEYERMLKELELDNID